MLRNVRLKNFLIKNIFPVFSLVNRLVPKQKNTILIYCSNEALKDNDRAIYDYLIKNRFYHKYKIICGVQNHRSYKKPSSKNVKYIPKQFGILAYFRAAYVFYSFGKIPIKPTKDQTVIYLTHGIPLKRSATIKDDAFFTYMSITSNFFKEKIAKAYDCPKDKICICGEPKTDKMFSFQEDAGETKLIIWTPTFRQSEYLGYDDSKMSSFLPFVRNDEWEELNEVLRNRNVNIMVKLHPAQTLNGFSEAHYSNLEIYSDRAFQQKGLELYELLGRSNALIADYSSVYLEYLLLNRPIGFALADYEDYKDTRGFVLGDQIKYMPGKKIYSLDDLYEYIDDVANDRDTYKVDRENMADLFHCYKDGCNTKRILDIAGISI